MMPTLPPPNAPFSRIILSAGAGILLVDGRAYFYRLSGGQLLILSQEGVVVLTLDGSESIEAHARITVGHA